MVGVRLFAAGMLEEAEDGVVGGLLDELLGVDVLAERHGGFWTGEGGVGEFVNGAAQDGSGKRWRIGLTVPVR